MRGEAAASGRQRPVSQSVSQSIIQSISPVFHIDITQENYFLSKYIKLSHREENTSFNTELRVVSPGLVRSLSRCSAPLTGCSLLSDLHGPGAETHCCEDSDSGGHISGTTFKINLRFNGRFSILLVWRVFKVAFTEPPVCSWFIVFDFTIPTPFS